MVCKVLERNGKFTMRDKRQFTNFNLSKTTLSIKYCSKSIKGQHIKHMVIYFVVLHNFALMKSVIVRMFY